MACELKSGLPSDVWAKVFENVLPQPPCDDDQANELPSRETVPSDLCKFQALQQVCKQFRQVFVENSHYHALLHLPRIMDERSWDSFLTWCACHQTKVQELYTMTREVAAALVAPASSQHFCPYSIRYPARCSIDCLLTSFTSLRNCSLDVSLFTHGRPLDLALMQNLHHLQCLSLRHGGFSQDDGICCNLNAVQHLTKLVLFAATVSAAANCSFVGRLQSLDVESGRLVGLHSDGLAACKHLSHFCCRSGVIAAQADMDTLITNSSATHIPSSMSTLVELTHLQMQLNPSLFVPETEWDIGWLTHLTALRKLELSSDYPCAMPLGISRLTDLEDLTLAVDSELLIVPSQVDWPAMCKLTQLHLRGISCSDGSRLRRLTEIRSLSEAHLAFFSITRYAARIGPKDFKVYHAMVKALREAFAINSPWIKLHCQCLTW